MTEPRCANARAVLKVFGHVGEEYRRMKKGGMRDLAIWFALSPGVEQAILWEDAARSCLCATCDPVAEIELGAGDA